MEAAEKATKFNLEPEFQTLSPMTQDEREAHEHSLEFAQHMLVSFSSMLGASIDVYIQEIQYQSEFLNRTFPHLWVNMHIFSP